MDKALNSSSVWQTKILPVMWTHVVARPSCAARCCLVSVHFNVRISVYVQKHVRLFIQKYGNYQLCPIWCKSFYFDKALCSFSCCASFCRMVCVVR